MRAVRLQSAADYDQDFVVQAFRTAYAEVLNTDADHVRRTMGAAHSMVDTYVATDSSALLIMRPPTDMLSKTAVAISFYAKGKEARELFVRIALDVMDSYGATSVQAVEHSLRVEAYTRVFSKLADVKPTGVIYEFKRK